MKFLTSLLFMSFLFSCNNKTEVQNPSMSKSEILNIIRTEQESIKSCYDQALKLDDSLEGKIVLSWSLASTGTVQNIKTTSDSLNSPSVKECLKELISTLDWPKLRNNEEMEINFPFVFSPT